MAGPAPSESAGSLINLICTQKKKKKKITQKLHANFTNNCKETASKTLNVKLESRKTEIVFSSKHTPLIFFIYSFKLLIFLFYSVAKLFLF